MTKKAIVIYILLLFPLFLSAQKVYLGSCTTSDGGQYKGEMVGGKPNGKGSAVYTNGDTYEGEYVKGKRNGYGVYSFSDGESYEGSWFSPSAAAKRLAAVSPNWSNSLNHI